MNAKQNFLSQILSNPQLGLDFSVIFNKTKNCEKSQITRKIDGLAIFCDFSQAHEKSQFLQLRTNLHISITLG